MQKPPENRDAASVAPDHTLRLSEVVLPHVCSGHDGPHEVMAAVPAPANQLTELSPPVVPPARPRVGFLDLSAELRNRIYLLLLKNPFIITVQAYRDVGDVGDAKPGFRMRRWKPFYGSEQIQIFTSIIWTCRTTLNDGSPIFYGANTFKFRNQLQLTCFAEMIGGNIKFLRYLSLQKIDNREEFQDTLTSLTLATSLKMVRFCMEAIQRFDSWVMAEDLELLVWTLWSANKAKAGVTLESIVDIFRFADHRAVPKTMEFDSDDELCKPLWFPRWDHTLLANNGGFFVDVLSYSGHDIEVEEVDNEETAFDPEYDYREAESGDEEEEEEEEEDDEEDDDNNVQYADHDPQPVSDRDPPPSKWNIRIRDFLLEDLRAAEDDEQERLSLLFEESRPED